LAKESYPATRHSPRFPLNFENPAFGGAGHTEVYALWDTNMAKFKAKLINLKGKLLSSLGLKNPSPKPEEPLPNPAKDIGDLRGSNPETAEVKPGFWRRWFHGEEPDEQTGPTSGFQAGLKSLYDSAAGYAQRGWKKFWNREEAVSINDVLKAELKEIEESRKTRMAGLTTSEEVADIKERFKEKTFARATAVGLSSGADAVDQGKVIEEERIERGRRSFKPLVNEIKNNYLVGVCFSGGGIRIATFNLGLITALAKRGYLKQIDYLSTVSGGGYIGSWLTAWIKRESCHHVEETLKKKTTTPDGRYLEPNPVRFLRKYSNYLAPRTGLLSTDLGALLAVYLRNVVLNVALLIAVGAFILALPLLGVRYGWTLAGRNLQGIFLALTRMFLVIAMGAIAYSFASFSSEVQPQFKIAQSIVNRPGRWVAAPLLAAAVLMTYVLTPGFEDKLSCVLGFFVSSQSLPPPESGWVVSHLFGWISHTKWFGWLSTLPAKSGHPQMLKWVMQGAFWYTVIWVAGYFAARVFEVFSGWHDLWKKGLKSVTSSKFNLFWDTLRDLKWKVLVGKGGGPKPVSKSGSVALMSTVLSGALGGLLLYAFGQLLANLPSALWHNVNARSGYRSGLCQSCALDHPWSSTAFMGCYSGFSFACWPAWTQLSGCQAGMAVASLCVTRADRSGLGGGDRAGAIRRSSVQIPFP
jgi:Patatin-like phospholipase